MYINVYQLPTSLNFCVKTSPVEHLLYVFEARPGKFPWLWGPDFLDHLHSRVDPPANSGVGRRTPIFIGKWHADPFGTMKYKPLDFLDFFLLL